MSDDRQVEVRLSEIGGLGVFATKSFASQDVIRRFAIEREITTADPLLPDENPDHAFIANGKFLLAGVPDRYMNHSCDPSTYVRYADDEIEVVARRKLEPGDELTLDYLINNDGGSSWLCNCRARRCRRLIGGSFFTLPELFQREYLPLLAEWFIQEHSSEVRMLREQLGL